MAKTYAQIVSAIRNATTPAALGALADDITALGGQSAQDLRSMVATKRSALSAKAKAKAK